MSKNNGWPSRENIGPLLSRTARLNGWQRSHNNLDYHHLIFTRPEKSGGLSRISIRLCGSHASEVIFESYGATRKGWLPHYSEVENFLKARPQDA